MLNFKQLICCVVTLLYILANRAEGSCVLNVAREKRPLITHKLGSLVYLIEKEEAITINEDDRIQAYCSNGFKTFRTSDYANHNTNNVLNLKCFSNEIQFNVDEISDDYDEYHRNQRRVTLQSGQVLQCIGTTYAIYESKHTLPSCKHYLSYILGAQLNRPLLIAGLCYDLEKLKLKYVNFKLHEPITWLENAKKFYPIGLNGSSLSEPLKSFDHIFQSPFFINEFNSMIEKNEMNFWLRIANFEQHNIIQSGTYYSTAFQELESFFNIIWWHNLRIGNWRRFNELLEKRAESILYNVFTGTSGVLRIPADKTKCKSETTHELKLSGIKTTAPEFIWTFLQSTAENQTENFVVVAYNSPYFEYFEKNSTILCKDMCQEIEWLQPIEDSRRISTLGILYCCRYDEVVGILDGLPTDLVKAPEKVDVLNLFKDHSSTAKP